MALICSRLGFLAGLNEIGPFISYGGFFLKRWAAARHTQLFLLFLSTRLKKEPKKKTTVRSFTTTFSLLLFPGRADRWIELRVWLTAVYLHIYTTIHPFPWNETTLKHTITHIYTLKGTVQLKTIKNYMFQNYMTFCWMWSTKEDI